MAKTISPDELVPMDLFCEDFALRIDLAYSRDEAPNIFGVIYRADARLWLHERLAKIVLLAAHRLQADHGLGLVLYDGLRTTEAQARMSASAIVQKNPHWLEEPGRLLSPPGAGAHPRGMAIDLSLLDAGGAPLDMGTAFDHLAENSSPAHNPAHREYDGISNEAKANRALLTDAMVSAAAALDTPLLPLPQEWWDFRLPADIYDTYAPLSDADLPLIMRMVGGGSNDSPMTQLSALRQSVLDQLAPHLR